MFIKELSAKNYRTLENVAIQFNGYYTAISGKNNAGKSNVFRALQSVMNRGAGIWFGFNGRPLRRVGAVEWDLDVTGWKKEQKAPIEITIKANVSHEKDAAIFRYITEMVFKDAKDISGSSETELVISAVANPGEKVAYRIQFGDKEMTDDFAKRSFLNHLQEVECLIFHNSTCMYAFDPFGDNIDSIENFIEKSDLQRIDKAKGRLNTLMRKALKNKEKELSSLYNALEEKYEVSLSTQGISFERETINISLKEKGTNVSLDDWGSGTKNRTLILLNLQNAGRMAKSPIDSDRITPIVLIEEPECFLHPQAQAEFGRVLKDLANQLKIQVITTTHSPYMLSFQKPQANILIERDMKPKSKDVASHVADTDQIDWCRPFATALGLNVIDFGPFKNIIFNENSKILLVEGNLDKEYFEYFQDKGVHGDNALRNDIEIYPYDGADNIKNNILMGFIKKKSRKVVVTVDLDKYSDLKSHVIRIGFKENQDLFSVGMSESGKECIEGLLPDGIWKQVASGNVNLVRQIATSTKNGARPAKSTLKQRLLERVRAGSFAPNEFKDFYTLIRKINKAFS